MFYSHACKKERESMCVMSRGWKKKNLMFKNMNDTQIHCKRSINRKPFWGLCTLLAQEPVDLIKLCGLYPVIGSRVLLHSGGLTGPTSCLNHSSNSLMCHLLWSHSPNCLNFLPCCCSNMRWANVYRATMGRGLLRNDRKRGAPSVSRSSMRCSPMLRRRRSWDKRTYGQTQTTEHSSTGAPQPQLHRLLWSTANTLPDIDCTSSNYICWDDHCRATVKCLSRERSEAGGTSHIAAPLNVTHLSWYRGGVAAD